MAPPYAAYHARVRELLQRYVTLSNGKLSLELLEPEPFSDAEDRAVADGLQGVPLNQAGELGYFGLAGSNSTDGHAVVPFFNVEREPFLEYDLTKLIHGLANPGSAGAGRHLGSAHEAAHGGMPRAAPPPLLVLDQIREFFTVEDIEPETATIADKVKTLMIADLKGLSGDALRAVDRFVHDGGRALVFADPLVETSRGVRRRRCTRRRKTWRSCWQPGASNSSTARWRATSTRRGGSAPASAAASATTSPG